MAKYIYTKTTPSAFTLNHGNDYHLHEGNEYELPEDNAFVQCLVDQGFLVPSPSTGDVITEETPKIVKQTREKK